MTDLNDERSARQVVDGVYKDDDENIKSIALSILADAVKEANVYGRGQWTLRVEDTARLLVGRYYVCTLRPAGVWMALDDRFTKTEDTYYPTMGDLASWGWAPDGPDSNGPHPGYQDTKQRYFSVNGFYTIGANHHDSWPHVRKLLVDFIYKALNHGQPFRDTSFPLHSQGMLKYMRHYLGTDLPDPLYRPRS